MDGLKIYTPQDIAGLINQRKGEIKLGERVQFISSLKDLASSSAEFVLLGIPEDVGVRANCGIGGAHTAWQPALKAMLNIQSNQFLTGNEIIVLGHFNFTVSEDGTIPDLQEKVQTIDEAVYRCIETIISAGKVPIVIGGGHNNAYPLIKGASLAKKISIDVINIDAHADLRAPNGRHSGNGFSYAMQEGFLGKYGIFGLHQNYNNEAILNQINSNENIYAVFFDDLLLKSDSISQPWNALLKKLDSPGLEIDLDSIENILSSASSPSGFSLNEVRKLILTANKKFSYLHICEGAAILEDGRYSYSTPKAIAYLLSDFLKAQNQRKPMH